jgi:spore coat polysaccharide biosynthesis predicted glycosyltransferase SpsG
MSDPHPRHEQSNAALRWAFRVATDPRAGAGHVARCHALAAALTGPIALYADPGGGDERRSFEWAGTVAREKSVTSMELALAALAERRVDALVVDSYSIDPSALARAAAIGFTAAFCDGPPYGPETVTVDASPGGLARGNVLAGPRYAALPPIYAQLCASLRKRPMSDPPAILIAFGARDGAHRAATAVQAIALLRRPVAAMIALSAASPGYNHIVAAARGERRIEIVTDPPHMHLLYREFDLAIGAPGISQFERACCGLPSVLVAQNTRQEPLAAAWDTTGAAARSSATPSAIANIVDDLLAHPLRLARMHDRGRRLVDGRGAHRIAEFLAERLTSRMSGTRPDNAR